MVSYFYVNKLKSGDVFRDWLVEQLSDRVNNRACEVQVFKCSTASHTVCRFRFRGEHLSVVAKFFAEPTGKLKNYNACDAMVNEYNNLKKAASLINVGKPLAINRDLNCVLVTEYVKGKSLAWYLKREEDLYEKLSSVAQMLKTLHSSTRNHYNKENEFKNYHEVLTHLKLDSTTRETFNRLLGEWWHSPLLDRKYGCMIHRDVTPANYIFQKGIPYAIDFESSWHQANPVRDLGILCAELKNYFEQNNGGGLKAEPYIGHFLWEYSRDEGEFEKVTEVLPFYMALGLLRSARLHRSEYRNYLIREAIACLKAVR